VDDIVGEVYLQRTGRGGLGRDQEIADGVAACLEDSGIGMARKCLRDWRFPMTGKNAKSMPAPAA
jgi:hypothetical protein